MLDYYEKQSVMLAILYHKDFTDKYKIKLIKGIVK